MPSMTASPRNSKPDLSSHTQVRQLYNGPTPAHATFDISPSAMQAATTSTEAPLHPGPAGYFGFVVDPNDPVYGTHSKKNWSPASSSIRSTAARSPLPIHLDNPPTLFKMQTEMLAQKHQIQRSLGPVMTKKPLLGGHKGSSFSAVPSSGNGDDYFSTVRTSSPVKLDDTGSDQPWPPIALPNTILSSGLASPTLKLPSRATGAPSPAKELPELISATHLADLISKCSTNSLLLLDVRTYKSFAESRVLTAVNLCIPTTLLKRPSFNVAKLSDTFANSQDKERFGRWKQMKYIVVYDADSRDANDPSALAALHTLGKFPREGWGGQAYILKGRIIAAGLMVWLLIGLHRWFRGFLLGFPRQGRFGTDGQQSGYVQGRSEPEGSRWVGQQGSRWRRVQLPVTDPQVGCEPFLFKHQTEYGSHRRCWRDSHPTAHNNGQ